jgi:hypothetical protein
MRSGDANARTSPNNQIPACIKGMEAPGEGWERITTNGLSRVSRSQETKAWLIGAFICACLRTFAFQLLLLGQRT